MNEGISIDPVFGLNYLSFETNYNFTSAMESLKLKVDISVQSNFKRPTFFKWIFEIEVH